VWGAPVSPNAGGGPTGPRGSAVWAGPGGAGEAELARLVEEAGGRRWTVERAAEHADGARRRLRSLADGPGAVPGAVADLDALCELVVNRSY
ncbi:hypothetical protein ACFV61_35125, partial [Kitasatospora sp. NPDC059817]